jgi:hypothetical protein
MGGRRVTQVWPVPLYTGVNLVGSSVQNNAGILSGFTSSSYATMPYYWTGGATSVEAVIKIHHTGASNAQGVWGCVGSKNAFTPFYQNYQYGTATFGSYLSTNGSSWVITPAGDAGTRRVAWNNSSPFAAGDYILREKWDGTTVTTSRWANGAWTSAETSASLSGIYGEAALVPQLGTNRGSNNPFLGTIDLNYTYLYRDGELWWEGAAGAYRNVKTEYPDA